MNCLHGLMCLAPLSAKALCICTYCQSCVRSVVGYIGQRYWYRLSAVYQQPKFKFNDSVEKLPVKQSKYVLSGRRYVLNGRLYVLNGRRYVLNGRKYVLNGRRYVLNGRKLEHSCILARLLVSVDICHPSSVMGMSAKLHISASLVPGPIVCVVLCAAWHGKNIRLQQPCAVCYFLHYTDREVGWGGRTGR